MYVGYDYGYLGGPGCIGYDYGCLGGPWYIGDDYGYLGGPGRLSLGFKVLGCGLEEFGTLKPEEWKPSGEPT